MMKIILAAIMVASLAGCVNPGDQAHLNSLEAQCHNPNDPDARDACTAAYYQGLKNQQEAAQSEREIGTAALIGLGVGALVGSSMSGSYHHGGHWRPYHGSMYHR